MKKVVFICLSALLLVSCINDEPVVKSKVVSLHVNSNDWQAYSDNNRKNMFYAVDFSMPEIDNDVYDKGAVQTFLVTETQSPLPAVRHRQDQNNYMWTRTIDFEYQPGTMRIFVTSSDFVASTPESMDFKVIIDK